jgi:hypothetical protein
VYIHNPVERELRVRLQAVLSSTSPGLETEEERKRPMEEEKKEAEESTAASMWSDLPSSPACSASVLPDWVHLSAYDDIVEESAVWQDKQKQGTEHWKDNAQVHRSHATTADRP